MNIILLATAWGPKEGGVNAFNEDFALGLAAYETEKDKAVYCLVSDCEPSDIASAAIGGVHLIKVAGPGGQARSFDKIPPAALVRLAGLPDLGPDDIWVGHDTLTGLAAKEAAKASGSRSALIMHMDYEAYIAVRENDSQEARKRYEQQKDLFNGAGFHFAVGPLLRDALSDMIGGIDGNAKMLVPGMPEIEPDTAKNQLRCVAFGRLDAHNDVVKQGALTSAAFARAQEEMRGYEDLKTLSTRLSMFGVPNVEEKDLLEFADGRAGSVANILALPYEEDRKKLFKVLANANLAIVPSFHDGFALTGWEAIAAETPLIVGENTGLWRLLAEIWSTGFATTVVNSISVRGSRASGGAKPFTEDDEIALTKLIVESARNMDARVRMAVELKGIIQEKRDGCTWKRTAEEFLVGVDFIKDPAAETKAIEGRWLGFFIEGSTSVRPPQVLRETILLRWRPGKDELEGGSVYEAAEGERAEGFTRLRVRHGVLTGRTQVTRGGTQESSGRFQLARRCEGKLLDGIASWPSIIKNEIDWSRYIWVRDEEGNDDLLAFAERAMAAEQAVVMSRIQQRSEMPVPYERPDVGTQDV